MKTSQGLRPLRNTYIVRIHVVFRRALSPGGPVLHSCFFLPTTSSGDHPSLMRLSIVL